MSKQRASRKITSEMGECIRFAVVSLAGVRKKAIQFPFEPTQEALVGMIDSTMSPEVLDAMEVIRRSPQSNVLDFVTHTKVCVDETLIHIHLPRSVLGLNTSSSTKIPDMDFPCQIREDNPLYASVSKWASENEKLKVLETDAIRLVRYLVDECATTGQLVRLWPDISTFMDEDIAAALGGSKRASRIPETIIGEGLESINQRVPKATRFLAQMALLKDLPEGTSKRVWLD